MSIIIIIMHANAEKNLAHFLTPTDIPGVPSPFVNLSFQ